jgi:hypothetical protein
MNDHLPEFGRLKKWLMQAVDECSGAVLERAVLKQKIHFRKQFCLTLHQYFDNSYSFTLIG